MITFRFLNKVELWNYVQSPEFEEMPHVPITLHRAESHVKNPKAGLAHPLMLLAEREGRLMGYLGVMPELVHGFGNDPVTCGWLTGMWVSSEARGQGIAGRLLTKMNEAYAGKLLLADYVPATIRVYEKTKQFTGPLSLNGFRGYLRFDLATILPARNPKYKKYLGLLKGIDGLVNLFADRRFVFLKNGNKNYQEVDLLDMESLKFVNQKMQSYSFQRSGEELQWMIEYPWVLTGDPKDALNKRYQFSAIDRRFQNKFILVRNASGKLVGVVMICLRNEHLKIPHAFYEPEYIADVAGCIEQWMLSCKVNTFTVFYPELAAYFKVHRKVFLFKKDIQRKYLFSKGFAEAVDVSKLKIQDGDGDVGFT